MDRFTQGSKRSHHANVHTSHTEISKLITSDLLQSLLVDYRMDWDGIHGFAHWCRVRENGLYLAQNNGANANVVEYFAFFHDNQRQNDGHDPDHGRRASTLVRRKYADVLALTPEEIDLLCEACQGHTHGKTKANITVATCWDADRLDLMRVGIMPNQRYLCTPEAKAEETIQWAVERSVAWAEFRKRNRGW